MGRNLKSTPAAETTAPGVTSNSEVSNPQTVTDENLGATIEELKEELKAANAAKDAAVLRADAGDVTANELRNELSNVTNRAEAATVELAETFDKLTEALNALKQKGLELEELKKPADAVTVSNNTEEAEAKSYFDYNGRKYGFTARAPKRLNLDGHVQTQEELLNDEDAMISLIVGESAFVKQVF